MGHEMGTEDGKCRFQVAMYGFPPEENEEELWASKRNIVDDNGALGTAWALHCLKSRANFSPYIWTFCSLSSRSQRRPHPLQFKSIEAFLAAMGTTKGVISRKTILVMRSLVATYMAWVAAVRVARRPLHRTLRRWSVWDKIKHGCQLATNLSTAALICRTAVYREEVCRQALCNECWSQAMMLANDRGRKAAGGTRRRASRVYTIKTRNKIDWKIEIQLLQYIF